VLSKDVLLMVREVMLCPSLVIIREGGVNGWHPRVSDLITMGSDVSPCFLIT
jgi:hypothetical protein